MAKWFISALIDWRIMTNRQNDTFYEIVKYAIKNNGAMPTIREVAELMNIKHTSVLQHITQLRIKDYLIKKGKLQFTNKGYKLYIQYQLDKIKTEKREI